MSIEERLFSRRHFLKSASAFGLLAGVSALAPAWARTLPGSSAGVGPARPLALEPTRRAGRRVEYDLVIDKTPFEVAGRRASAITINGTVPGPLIRLREGDDVILRYTNRLDEDTSIHWHGLLIPNPFDGVPGINFPGVAPGETFEAGPFKVRQYGTYWYHSHSGLQEQLGHYGPLVIDPAGEEPYAFDREVVVVLSDWTFEDPHDIMANLKKGEGYYNFQKRTVGDFWKDVGDEGFWDTLRNRLSWKRMRMEATDISDITGATYTYLMNGQAPDANWSALFNPGERVRLRFINASAATIFDVRVPGLEMNVIQVSGQHVQPVPTDEFRIGVAERYDVIVEPTEDQAYTVFAEAIDRSGYARGTLAPRFGLEAPVPERRKRPVLTMADMGMMHGGMGNMDGMNHGEMAMGGAAAGAAADSSMAEMDHGDMDHSQMDMGGKEGMGGMETDADSSAASDSSMAGMDHSKMNGVDHGQMDHSQMDMGAMAGGMAEAPKNGLRPPGTLSEPVMHDPGEGHGPGEAGVPMMTRSRLDEPGIGLGDDGWRVLTYAQLKALDEKEEFKAPDREIELHLTGNMERFMWGINGVEFSNADPILTEYGERIRLTIVNDTMMNHPMHLHGMFFELENGHGERSPLIDTVTVKPAERLSGLVTIYEPGPWFFHCHILYHMDTGMARVFYAVPEPGAEEEFYYDRVIAEKT